MTEQTSSGEHRKVGLYGGVIDVCDTCVNSFGYNVAWEQAHQEASVSDAEKETRRVAGERSGK